MPELLATRILHQRMDIQTAQCSKTFKRSYRMSLRFRANGKTAISRSQLEHFTKEVVQKAYG